MKKVLSPLGGVLLGASLLSGAAMAAPTPPSTPAASVALAGTPTPRGVSAEVLSADSSGRLVTVRCTDSGKILSARTIDAATKLCRAQRKD